MRCWRWESSIDKTSEELAKEVERLIDERNGMDRIPEETEKEEKDVLQGEPMQQEVM